MKWVQCFFGLFHLRMAILNMVYVLWRAPECGDFAHLNAIIQKLEKHGFTNGKKISNFRATEDLLLTIHKSYIDAWVIEEVRERYRTGMARIPNRGRILLQSTCARKVRSG